MRLPSSTLDAAGGRRLRARLLVVALLGGVLTLLFATPASAHATLLQCTPTDGSVVDEVPHQILLLFDETVGVSAGSVKILAPDGSRVDAPDASLQDGGTTVVQPLDHDLTSGTYTVLWRVLSEDTHSVFGATTFSVGQVSATSAGAEAAAAEQEGRGAEVVLDVLRLVLYLGIVGLVGGLAFTLLLRTGQDSSRIQRLLWVGWATTLFATLGALVAQGPYVAGEPIWSGFDVELIAGTLGTRFGVSTAIRIAVLVALFPLLRRRTTAGRPTMALMLAAGVAVLATVSLVGHAGTGELAAVALLADVAHLMAMSFWLGGLVVLLVAVLPAHPVGLPDLLRRWSTAALVAVGVLVVSGTFAGWRQARELGALTGTEYGWLLVAKVGLVLVIMATATVSRALVRRRWPTTAPAVRERSDQREQVDVVAGGSAIVATALAMRANRDSLQTTGTVMVTETTAGSDGSTGSPADRPNSAVVRRLRRSVLVEAFLAVVVLGVTSVLVATVPAKDSYFPVFDQTGPVTTNLTVQVTVTPARTGINQMRLQYRSSAEVPTDVIRASGRWTSADGAYVVPVDLARTAAGVYESVAATLPGAGTWQLALTTQTSDIDSTTTLFIVRIR